MLHTTMVKQPLVTLNTSVFEVPSQSRESFGEYGGESRQLMLSTGNNNEIIQANVREMVIKSKFLADQCEEDEDEDWGVEIAEESTDVTDQESADEDVLSVASPTLPKTYAKLKSKLNLNAPEFVPRNSPIMPKPGQQQHIKSTAGQ